MKTLMNILLVLLVVFSSVAFSQQIVADITTNVWTPYEWYSTKLDTANTKFSRNSSGRGEFSFYGVTGFYGGEWAIQVDFRTPLVLSTPDSVSIGFEVKGSMSNTYIGAILGVYDSSGSWCFLDGKILPVSGMKRFTWNMALVKYARPGWHGMKKIAELALSFPMGTLDSVYTGTRVEVSDITFIDSLGRKNVVEFALISTGVQGISELNQNPKGFVLEQNYPNPFNPSTTIRFAVPQKEQVKLTVYNSLGQEVKSLVNEEKSQGTYEATFNANNLPSGTYFYKFQTGTSMEVRKMVLLK